MCRSSKKSLHCVDTALVVPGDAAVSGVLSTDGIAVVAGRAADKRTERGGDSGSVDSRPTNHTASVPSSISVPQWFYLPQPLRGLLLRRSLRCRQTQHVVRSNRARANACSPCCACKSLHAQSDPRDQWNCWHTRGESSHGRGGASQRTGSITSSASTAFTGDKSPGRMAAFCLHEYLGDDPRLYRFCGDSLSCVV
jgi:hypothetical protein